MESISATLYEKGLFLIGDSAYCMESFLPPPYDNISSKSSEDDYNFYHSSARINVECDFGEIDLRWGIFWKRLNCSLENAAVIIEGAMHLHNYLVDFRKLENDHINQDSDRTIFIQDALDSGATPIQTGNNLGRPRGNIPNNERQSRLNSLTLRDNLRQQLQDHNMHRPCADEWYSDVYNHVRRESHNDSM